ncbi:DNA-directed RNA polymerase III subunit RPC10-like [Chenopodium quinoa]|uniref:DNA-directed RNA polymerase III subunit RPC10-like n=1 Tax=Chenopodium quinoa TaxID=63459 RepID=UPI000B778C42|nr:DNA-directed RNA polymerase III subunit RPC10-like [Chenopodium quinoa]XP_021761689.1 DNA-directed RNA polymerase III subunit RPC10-like [Chenopodium quinoa]XP_021761690.1 DNA-directed RNA polymerase III subunit RPC10-like [Chenopodium quinoa]
MEFCPTCANLLQYEMTNPARFFCRSCHYISPIERKVKIKRGVQLTNKEATPIAVGKKPVGDTTAATCPKCGHGEAEFKQFQTRSADEPMTILYKCLKEGCENIWKDD